MCQGTAPARRDFGVRRTDASPLQSLMCRVAAAKSAGDQSRPQTMATEVVRLPPMLNVRNFLVFMPVVRWRQASDLSITFPCLSPAIQSGHGGLPIRTCRLSATTSRRKWAQLFYIGRWLISFESAALKSYAL